MRIWKFFLQLGASIRHAASRDQSAGILDMGIVVVLGECMRDKIMRKSTSRKYLPASLIKGARHIADRATETLGRKTGFSQADLAVWLG